MCQGPVHRDLAGEAPVRSDVQKLTGDEDAPYCAASGTPTSRSTTAHRSHFKG
jgi:hypothetical protein